MARNDAPTARLPFKPSRRPLIARVTNSAIFVLARYRGASGVQLGSYNVEIRKVGIIMNGVTGRMGTNQHLLRSIKAIIDQGGIKIGESEQLAIGLLRSEEQP